MKRAFTIFLLIILMVSFFSSTIYGYKECEWYIKRCGNETPIFPPEAAQIGQYNAYFIGKSGSESNDRKRIYITFDAGYENGNIEKILDILKEENVPAAFFLLDHVILKNTDLVLRMTAEGHTVCNHTTNHKNLSSATKEEIEKNLTTLERIYKEKTGQEMSKYFRFPEGKYSIAALKSVNDLGYKTIFWSFGYDDWDNNRQPDESRAIKKILDNTHDGEVLLLHPTSSTNAAILPTLIREWRKMGYEFGTLDELTDNE